MLTRSGLGAAGIAIILALCGWWWRYEELVVAAAGVAVAVAVALWSARTPYRATVRRVVDEPRVARGDPIRTRYRVLNSSRRRSPSASLRDSCDGVETLVRVPSVGGGDLVEQRGRIPTRRRGVFELGPLVVERVDPLGLAVGQRRIAAESSVIVHPRVYRLHGPYGAMHTIEDEAVIRKAASDPLSGFVSLREYVDGDDPRLIHWPTSARMGTLMLREHVELRRPEFTVVLDAARDVATPDDFEEMVDVAASVAVHALRSGVDVTLRTTARDHPGDLRPIDRETRILDVLTPVDQVDRDTSRSLAEIFHGGVDHTAIVMITGPAGPSSTLANTAKTSIARVGRGAAPAPGITLAANDAAQFALRWRP